MKKGWLILGLLVIGCCAGVLFHVKYQVQYIERDIAEVKRQIHDDEEAIHVLKAEWSYLDSPERLRKLSDEHLHLVPQDIRQVSMLNPTSMALARIVQQDQGAITVASKVKNQVEPAENVAQIGMDASSLEKNHTIR